MNIDDRQRPPVRWLGHAAILLVASQAVFWSGLWLAENKGRPDNLGTPAFVTMWFADTSGQKLVDEAPITVPANAEPAYIYVDPNLRAAAWFEHTFTVSARPGQMGVLLGWDRRIVDVRLNGVPLKTQSPIDVWGILGGHDPVVYSFPAEYLRKGENTLELLNNGRSRKILPYFFIGPLDRLYTANTWLRMFSVDLVVVSIGVLLFAMLLGGLIHWSVADKTRALVLNLLLLAWAVRNLSFLGIDGAIPDPYRLLLHFVVTYAFLFAFLAFAIGWTRKNKRLLIIPAIGLLVCTVIAAAATFVSAKTLFVVAFAVETGLTLIIGLSAAALFLNYWVKSQRKETIEVVLFLICGTAIVVDAIDDRWLVSIPFTDIPLTFYAAPMCGLLLALGMVASLAAQSTRARKATENVNEVLRARLGEQEQRLTASHEREKQIEKQRVLMDERQRIIRDMHDGVGGSLMSLLLRARRKELSQESMATALERSMRDLRLIIESFDHVGDNLAFALGAFRQRVEPELAANGVSLIFDTREAGSIPGYGPEAVLHIYRILQEACSNAINHGQAGQIAIRLRAKPGDTVFTIEVCDDGGGFDLTETTGGSGLSNMRQRAASLQGELEISSDTAGTRISLSLPKLEAAASSTSIDQR